MKHSILLLSALTTLLAACSESEDSPIEEKAETRAVQLAVPLTNSMKADDLHVFFFDKAGVQLISRPNQINTDTTRDGLCDKIHITLFPDNKAIKDGHLSGRMVALAHCENVPDEPTVSELTQLTYSDLSKGVPMYGAHDYDLDLIESYEVTGESFSLLRSAALVTVRLGQNLIDQGVRLSDCVIPQETNITGYCLPSTSLITTGKDYLDSQVFRPLPSKTDKNVKFETTDGGKSMQVMLPDTHNDGNLSMVVSFTINGIEMDGMFGKTIYFKDYTTNEKYHIIRNKHYIFTITGLTIDFIIGDITDIEDGLNTQVKDWVNEEPETLVFK